MNHVTQVFAGGLVSAVQQLEVLEKECAALRQSRDRETARCESWQRISDMVGRERNEAQKERDSARADAAHQQSNCDNLQLENDALRALLREAAMFVPRTTSRHDLLHERIDAALSRGG